VQKQWLTFVAFVPPEERAVRTPLGRTESQLFLPGQQGETLGREGMTLGRDLHGTTETPNWRYGLAEDPGVKNKSCQL
jgi:hypothetical protein